MKKISLSIPCASCGCDTIIANRKRDNAPSRISICACDAEDGYFDMTLEYNYDNSDMTDVHYEKFKSKDDIESYLGAVFDPTQINHHCTDTTTVFIKMGGC